MVMANDNPAGSIFKTIVQCAIGLGLLAWVANWWAAGRPERMLREEQARANRAAVIAERQILLQDIPPIVVEPGTSVSAQTHGRPFGWQIRRAENEFTLAHVSVLINGQWQSPEDPAKDYAVDRGYTKIRFPKQLQWQTTAIKFEVPARAERCPTRRTAFIITFTD